MLRISFEEEGEGSVFIPGEHIQFFCLVFLVQVHGSLVESFTPADLHHLRGFAASAQQRVVVSQGIREDAQRRPSLENNKEHKEGSRDDPGEKGRQSLLQPECECSPAEGGDDIEGRINREQVAVEFLGTQVHSQAEDEYCDQQAEKGAADARFGEEVLFGEESPGSSQEAEQGDGGGAPKVG